jgi:hypothetical protein
MDQELLANISRRAELVEPWIGWLSRSDAAMRHAEARGDRDAFEAAATMWSLMLGTIICPEGTREERRPFLTRWVSQMPIERVRSAWLIMTMIGGVHSEKLGPSEAKIMLGNEAIMHVAKEWGLPKDVVDDVKSILDGRPRIDDMMSQTWPEGSPSSGGSREPPSRKPWWRFW